ncbi:TPA: cysteine hydrolase [Clostridium botulinum]|nr:cysteine hydrolase [Clostridium botulinum]
MVKAKQYVVNAIPMLDLDVLSIEEFTKDDTVVIFINMVKGFFEMGIMYDQRYRKIIPNIVALNELTLGFDKVFASDEHNEDCLEFEIYPTHCVKGSEETKIIPELIGPEMLSPNVTIISKNSGNAMYAKGFMEWLREHNHIKNFIITGVSVDTGILHLALSLKSYLNENNRVNRIVIPVDCVETYELDHHNGDMVKDMVLLLLKINGIDIVNGIE